MALSLGALHAAAQDERAQALLGVIAVDATKGVRIAEVLPESPAFAAGLKSGDVLLSLAGKKLGSPLDLDAAVQRSAAGKKLSFKAQRASGEAKQEGKPATHEKLEGEVQLIERAPYAREHIRGRKRGEVGFKAPEWYAFAWDGVAKDEAPPSLTNTRGKVVVIHAFQSW